MEKKIKTQAQTDHWSQDGQTYILAGKGYRVNRELESVCVGPVDDDGEPWDPTTAAAAPVRQRVKVVANQNGDVYIGSENATVYFEVAKRQNMTAYALTKKLNELGFGVSCRTIGRVMVGQGAAA